MAPSASAPRKFTPSKRGNPPTRDEGIERRALDSFIDKTNDGQHAQAMTGHLSGLLPGMQRRRPPSPLLGPSAAGGDE
jgi:hypothetical protein